jgi:hypothetical protein
MMIRMRMIVVLAMWVAISVTGVRAADVVGTGARSCGDWKADHQHEDAVSVSDDAWVAGYLSGYSIWSADDAPKLPDLGARSTWMNNYCRSHPLDHILEAVNQLIFELQRRQAARR